MLKLIYGPSGAGKTRLLIDLIRADIENGIRCYLLLPEQQGYIGERDLPSALPQNAGLFFEVTSFSGLCEDVFRTYGGLTKHSIDRGLQMLLMWNTLRTLSPLFKQYRTSGHFDSALAELMLGTINELRASGISTDALEDAAKVLPTDSPLGKKLSDVALADAAYHAALEKTFGNDPAERLSRMAQILADHRFFEGAHLYIDSFAGFTAPEYAVLCEMIKQTDVAVSLCTDSLRSALPHFESVSETASQLLKLAAQANTPVDRIPLTVTESKKPAALQYLERELWNFSLKKEEREVLDKNDDSIRLILASNIYEESEAAAIRICELVQSGMRYGDIAVVVRDTESYRGVLDAALERHGIPYFLSERTDLSLKPVTRLLLSALRAVSHNYRASDVITLLKTGLCGVELRDAAMFEEYCETWHIGGKRFTDPVWSMNPDGLTTERSARAEVILEAANRVRKQLITPLEKLSAALRTSKRLIDRCRALYEYLGDMELSKRLSDRARAEITLGQVREAGETVRLYRMITDTLTTLCRLMPNEEMTLDEFICALTLLFSNTNLGSVPNANDCVVIGSASVLRVENVRASLLLGLCEGEFPRAVTDDGILTEGDKEMMEALGIIMNSRERIRSSEELLYVYRAMTKPGESLSLFTTAKQTDGSARTPSLAFSRVAFLTDRRPAFFDAGAVALTAERYDSTKPTPTLSSAPSPITTLRLSQSKIQAFVLCPYRYYSTYRLALREKKDSTPSYADDGVFLHYVFEHFLRASLNEDGTLRLPDIEEVKPMADGIIAEYIASVCPFPMDDLNGRILHLYARLRKLAIRILYEILFELRNSAFVPYRFEQIIGLPGENGLPPVTITLDNGTRVLLSGKIDRIDLYKTEDKLYVRVVDYKSGKHTFSLDQVRSGMDIQLVLYLYAFLTAEPNAQAAGAQYLFASTDGGQTEIKRSGFYLDTEEIQRAAYGDEPPRSGDKIIKQSAEEIESLHREMCEAVGTVANRILAGEVEKTPSEEACTFCPVRHNCNKAYHR